MRIGLPEDFAPFCWRGPDGQAAGQLVEAIRKPGIMFVPARLQDLPGMLACGEIDAILPKAATADRAGVWTFSRPLAFTAAALFGPAGHPVPSVEQAGTARIATPEAGPLAALLPRLAPDAQVVPVADYAGAFAAVRDGLADYAALNADAGAVMAQAAFASGPRFAEFGLCLAVPNGDPGGVLARLGLT